MSIPHPPRREVEKRSYEDKAKRKFREAPSYLPLKERYQYITREPPSLVMFRKAAVDSRRTDHVAYPGYRLQPFENIFQIPGVQPPEPSDTTEKAISLDDKYSPFFDDKGNQLTFMEAIRELQADWHDSFRSMFISQLLTIDVKPSYH